MGFDAVVIGAILSVVVTIVVFGVAVYRVIKGMGDSEPSDN